MKDKDKLIVLLGPTGVGKTSVSIEVAQNLQGEIISSDSMQIYKHMDIGTAKIQENEMAGIPHYLIDIVYPDEEFTVHDFKSHAKRHINDINGRGSMPIMVGGTGLYVNSIVYKLRFTNVEPDDELRIKYSKFADKYGNEALHAKLSQRDPKSAKQIDINDRKRVIRALEIYDVSGQPMSHLNRNFRRENKDYNLAMIGLNMDRQILYSRINRRVEEMFEEGLVKEVEDLLKRGYDEELVSMKAIGYKEIIPYIKGEVNLEESMELLKRNTRRYAKRQLTWFRRDKRIKWLDVNKFSSSKVIGGVIAKYVKDVI